jgi:hypothetical protein
MNRVPVRLGIPNAADSSAPKLAGPVINPTWSCSAGAAPAAPKENLTKGFEENERSPPVTDSGFGSPAALACVWPGQPGKWPDSPGCDLSGKVA